MLGRVLHININVADLDRSVAFYEALGFTAAAHFAFTQEEAAPTCAAFAIPPMPFSGAIMTLGDDPDATVIDLIRWDSPVAAAPAPTNAIGLSRLALTTGDAQAMLARLERVGVPILGPPSRIGGVGGLSYELFCFRDPDGAILEVVG